MGAFHAYDIRGIYGVDFDSSLAYKVGYFIPSLLRADKVLVGRDCRVSSDEIHDSLVRGICDSGADVYDLGLSSTPLVYYGTASHSFKASVQITASHNSPEYNGLKVSRENALPVGLESGLGTIKAWIEEGRPTPVATVRGSVHILDLKEEYLAFQKRFLEDYTGLKVVFDLSNGMANLFAKSIFGESGNFRYLFDSLDGRFPNHDPNPLVRKNVEPLMKEVVSFGADLGVIYDGDADRVMFVDEKGEFVPPDLVVALMSRYFIKEKGAQKPRVLQEIRTSKAVSEYLEPLGCEVHTWRVGRAYAAPKLREIDGLWGGELAGHYYFKDFFYSDSGLLSSMIVLNIVDALKKEGLSLSEAIAEIARYENSGEINFRVEDKQGAMDAVKEMFTSAEKEEAFMDFDGYRIEFKDWWFNIRPSNTEPYLRFICEAGSKKLMNEKIEAVKKLLKEKYNAICQ